MEEHRISRIKQSLLYRRLKENPLIALPIVLLAILLILFWQAVVVLGLVAITILIIVKLLYTGPSLKELMARKRTLLSEIELLEKNYMRRRISKKDFMGTFRKKQTKLIELEALIDEKFNREKLPEQRDPRVREIAAKKRHIVEALLGDKKRTLKELEIAQRMYLKRKIDAATYQNLIREKQERLIELEAQLKQIYGGESISQIIGELKKRLAAVERQREERLEKERKAKSEKERNIAEQIAEQLRDIK